MTSFIPKESCDAENAVLVNKFMPMDSFYAYSGIAIMFVFFFAVMRLLIESAVMGLGPDPADRGRCRAAENIGKSHVRRANARQQKLPIGRSTLTP